MKSHIIIDKRKVIDDNRETIKDCFNVTLDEEYDYLESLKTDEAPEETRKMFETLAADHEALRRALIDKAELTDLQVEEIGLVLKHRAGVMQVKLDQLKQATQIITTLAKNFE